MKYKNKMSLEIVDKEKRHGQRKLFLQRVKIIKKKLNSEWWLVEPILHYHRSKYQHIEVWKSFLPLLLFERLLHVVTLKVVVRNVHPQSQDEVKWHNIELHIRKPITSYSNRKISFAGHLIGKDKYAY